MCKKGTTKDIKRLLFGYRVYAGDRERILYIPVQRYIPGPAEVVYSFIETRTKH